MIHNVGSFTMTALVAATGEILERAGFQAVDPQTDLGWHATSTRVYEDPYCVVGVAVYDTWEDLFDRWFEDQSTLVQLISGHFTRKDPKAWDGYLVLLTPSVVGTNERRDTEIIQRDTRHLRKLLAHREGFSSVDDVRRILLPLLPIDEQVATQAINALDSLPELLASRGFDKEAVQVAVTAFREGQPIVAQVHAYRGTKDEDS